MNVELKPHQKEGLKYILEHKRSGLYLATGGGKSLTSLVYLKILDCPAMVIVPGYLKKVWYEENEKFGLGLDLKFDYNQRGKIFVVSYDWLKNYPEIIDEYDTVVLDEVLSVSNTNTVRFKQLAKRLRQKDRLVILAGYPTENNLIEVYVASLITDELGSDYYQFLYRYFDVIRKGNRIVRCTPKKGAFAKIMAILRKYVFLVDKQTILPNIRHDILVVRYELSDYQIDMLERLRGSGYYLDNDVELRCESPLVLIQKAMQIISGFVYVNEPDDVNPFHVELGIVDKKVKSKPIPVFFKDNPKLDKAKEIVRDKMNYLSWYFYDAEESMVSSFTHYTSRMCKLQHCRGLNLQSYDFSLYYSVPLSGGMFLQSADRLYRLGRDRDVISVLLLPHGEFGAWLYNLVQRKQKLTKRVINSLLNKSFHK